MLLITEIKNHELKRLRSNILKCLNQNIKNPNINKIIVFLDNNHHNLPKNNKISYIIKKGYTELDKVKYVKNLYNHKRLIFSDIFTIFNHMLIKIKNTNLVYYRENEYVIFNNDSFIDNGLDKIRNTKTTHILSKNIRKDIHKEDKKKVIREKGKKIIVNKKPEQLKLDVIIVSIGFSNILKETIKYNSQIFDNITIVTHEKDTKCIELCQENNIKYIFSDNCIKNNELNKSIAINDGIKSLDSPDWILILDADIIVNKKPDVNNLMRDCLYTSGRYITSTEKVKEWKSDKININQLGRFEADKGLGFFQLFNITKENKYPDSKEGRYSEGKWSDIEFRQKFLKRKTLSIGTIHIGKPYSKWDKINLDESNEIKSKIEKVNNITKTNEKKENVKELINEDNSILKKSKRDENIKPKLAVITTFFNPSNYINLKYNYIKFSEKIKEKADLFPIELSYDGEFFIDDENAIHIEGDERNTLWQKERLLNIALEKLPKEYTNVAWIDCDILFENENWVNEVNDKLNDYKILHLFEKSISLDGNGDDSRTSSSIIEVIKEDNKIPKGFGKGTPGFAWAGRRETLDKIKFLDIMIIGGGDSFMLSSFLNIQDSSIINKLNTYWLTSYKKWFSVAKNEVNLSVNNISGTITHLYHGSSKNRNYMNRHNILIKNNFNPKKDLEKDNSGLWALSSELINEQLKGYFNDRKEDDNIIDINTYFDNIYLLNLDRSKDRYYKSKNKLDKLGIKFERFSAIDGNVISDNEFNSFNFKRGTGMLENKYALACLRSHKAIIKDAKENNYKRILVLEDDVLINNDIKAHFQKLRKIKDWKLLYLGASQHNWNLEYIEDFYYCRRTLGTFAYAIDISLYDDILNYKGSESIDNVLSIFQKENYKECLSFFPYLCISDVSKSNIRDSRDQIKHNKRMKWNKLKIKGYENKYNTILKKSHRDENIKPKLAVITTFFNPSNYINLKYNYIKFSEKIKEKADLFPIELSYDGEFFIDDENAIHIEGDERNTLWQKERLLNIALEKLPKEYTNVAWIDCDILFENENWVNEVNDKLNDYKILHLYEKAIRLDRNGDDSITSSSIIEVIKEDKEIPKVFNKGIPGFAWAGRRETLDKIKFLDTQVIGGGDALMFYSFFNIHDSMFHTKMNNDWLDIYKKWGIKSYEEVNSSVNNISGTITHLYHGESVNRNYNNRYDILNKYNFDPKKDLEKNNNGLWTLSSEPINEGMRGYFNDRKEDDNIIDINTYFDNTYLIKSNNFEYKKTKHKLNKLNIHFKTIERIDYDYFGNKKIKDLTKEHKFIIKDAKENNYKKILILEDDISINNNIKAHFQKLRKVKDWKLLYLDYNQDSLNLIYNEDFYYSKEVINTFAYAIDNSIYDYILKHDDNIPIYNILNDLQKEDYKKCLSFSTKLCTIK